MNIELKEELIKHKKVLIENEEKLSENYSDNSETLMRNEDVGESLNNVLKIFLNLEEREKEVLLNCVLNIEMEESRKLLLKENLGGREGENEREVISRIKRYMESESNNRCLYQKYEEELKKDWEINKELINVLFNGHQKVENNKLFNDFFNNYIDKTRLNINNLLKDTESELNKEEIIYFLKWKINTLKNKINEQGRFEYSIKKIVQNENVLNDYVVRTMIEKKGLIDLSNYLMLSNRKWLNEKLDDILEYYKNSIKKEGVNSVILKNILAISYHGNENKKKLLNFLDNEKDLKNLIKLQECECRVEDVMENQKEYIEIELNKIFLKRVYRDLSETENSYAQKTSEENYEDMSVLLKIISKEIGYNFFIDNDKNVLVIENIFKKNEELNSFIDEFIGVKIFDLISLKMWEREDMLKQNELVKNIIEPIMNVLGNIVLRNELMDDVKKFNEGVEIKTKKIRKF